jgi:dienelactone hydrolase
MGGATGFFAATEHADVISAAVDFTAFSIHVYRSTRQSLKAPVQLHFGDHDKSIPRGRRRTD